MKTFLNPSAFLFVAMLSVATSLGQELRAEIEAAEQQWIELWNKRDAEALAKLYTDDAQRLVPDFGVIKGREAIQKQFVTAMKASGDAVEKATTLDVISSGDLVTETGTWTSERPDGSLNEEGTYIMLWKKEDGAWKVLREMWALTSSTRKLSDDLQPLEKLVGNWKTEAEFNGTKVRGTFSWKPAAGGSAISYEGILYLNDELANEWSGLIFYRPESKTIVDVGVSKTDGHGMATVHVSDDKIIFQGSGFNREGLPMTGVDEFIFEGKKIRFSQLYMYKDGRPADDLLKDVEFVRVD